MSGDEVGGSEAAGAASSRAGRDLPAAVAVAVLLGVVIVGTLFTQRQGFVAIVAVAILVGTVEMRGALRRGAGIEISLLPLLVGGQAMMWLSWPFGPVGVLSAFVATVLGCVLWRFRGGAVNYLRDLTSSVFVAAYLPLFGAFAGMLVIPADGLGRALCFLIGVVASDTGGYAAGVLTGRHPMAPSISPKKSWEGFAGSGLTGVVAGSLTLPLLLGAPVWQGAVFGLGLVLTATLGDLVMSLIKRDLGIKDMGKLLPGHGGLMDRLDSLIPSAVAAYLLLRLFVSG